MDTAKLIILRGPSGSGKSTVAKALFENAFRKVALIEQDYYRFMFRPAGGGGKANSATIHEMIKQNTVRALEDGYDVILEGILSVKSYDAILSEIFEEHPKNNFMYYFDVSFDETIKRHATRPDKAAQFGAEDMREWYPASHKSNHPLERIIPESNSLKQTVTQILSETNL